MELRFPDGMEALEGNGNFVLTEDYGFPDRSAGPLVLMAGATIDALIAGAPGEPVPQQCGIPCFKTPPEGTPDGYRAR